MTTRNTNDEYRTLTFEEKEGTRIVTFNDHMKETAFRHKDGREEVSYDMINEPEFDKLTAMHEALIEHEEPNIESDMSTDLDHLDELRSRSMEDRDIARER
jgi:hypothetical protein